MSKQSLRTIIIVLTLITAVVHGIILNFSGFSPLFALNAVAYLALLGALVFDFPAGQSKLVHYAFIAFTAVTIVAWYFINYLNGFGSLLGYLTKLDELLLIVFLWMHLQRIEA